MTVVHGIQCSYPPNSGSVYLCRPSAAFDGLEAQQLASNVKVEYFAGPAILLLSATHNPSFMISVSLNKASLVS